MQPHARTAVELTKGEDHVSIWVDANNNGLRDDDDVNIFVTKNGGFYTESASFKAALDGHLRDKLKEAAMALLEVYPRLDPVREDQICTMALDLIVRAHHDQGHAMPQPAAFEPALEPVAMQHAAQPPVPEAAPHYAPRQEPVDALAYEQPHVHAEASLNEDAHDTFLYAPPAR